MKKVFAFTLVMLLSSFILIIPASAESIETTAYLQGEIYGRRVGNENTSGWDDNFRPVNDSLVIPRQGNFTEYALNYNLYNVVNAYNFLSFGIRQFYVVSPDPSGFYGDVELSFNYYVVFNDYLDLPSGKWRYSEGRFKVLIYNANGEIEQEYTPNVEYYDVSQSIYPSYATSDGVHVTFTVNVPEATPILRIGFDMSGYGQISWTADDPYSGYHSDFSYFVPSSVLIADRTTAELEELRNITNIIIEQNNISNEFYGEIISKVDDLYTEVGNLADLQQEAIDQFDDWNIVSSVPGSVTDKTDQAEDVLDEFHQLEKPEPDQIVPELDTDTTEIAQILEPYFQNTLILNILMMTLGFGFVSYVLFGKKG